MRVSFKTRKPFTGVFIKTPEYDELKSKNFWRIVNEDNLERYLKSRDLNLARIFNGSEITKLAAEKSPV